MKVHLVPARGSHQWDVAGLRVAERTRRGLGTLRLTAEDAGDEPEAIVLLVAGDALIEPGAVQAFTRDAAPAEVALASANDLEAPAALRVPADTPIPNDADQLADLAARFRASGRLSVVSTGDSLCCRVRSQDAARRIERELLASLIQPTDGFFARHFDRHISARLSVALVRCGVHPNVVTMAATLIGLVGAWLLASAHCRVQVVGALLFIASTILDGCDGEVARLSLRRSDLGRRLDLIGDTVVDAAVFLAIGYGCLRAGPSEVMVIVVGAALVGLTLATAAGFTYSSWLVRSGRQEALYNRYESLVSRDFAYLILGLALFDRLGWFVWLASVGSYAFTILLVVLRLREWPPKEPALIDAGGEKAKLPVSTGPVAGNETGRRPIVDSNLEDALRW